MSKAQGMALRRSGVICDHADHDRARTESRRGKSDRLAPVMSDLRSRRSRMAGSVNIGNIGATEDAARRRFAAVATHAPSTTDLSQRLGSREISINHLVADWTTVA